MERSKCEACGLIGGEKYVHVRTLNGGLNLCEMCLADINGKNPELLKLRAAVAKHHAQKADDRCQFDDDELYAAAGLPAVDRRVGDKVAMLANCARFVERRCEGGGPWKSYAELEAENAQLRERLRKAVQ